MPEIATPPTRWTPDRAPPAAPDMPRWGTVIGRGIAGRCPRCGNAKMFAGYLKPVDACPACAAPLAAQPADDIHPWITLLIVAHVVGIAVTVSFLAGYDPGPGFIVGFAAAIVALTLWVLRLAKGVVIGILLKLGYRRRMEDASQ